MGAFAALLIGTGITLEQYVWWADEMRIAPFGTTRRARGLRWLEVQQRLQVLRERSYLRMAVDLLARPLWRFWSCTVQATNAETEVTAVTWHRGPSLPGATLRAAGRRPTEQVERLMGWHQVAEYLDALPKVHRAVQPNCFSCSRPNRIFEP